MTPDEMARAFIGHARDFDFLVGSWSVKNRKLCERLAGSDDWDEFDSAYEAWSHLDGAISVDEFRSVDGRALACSIRTLDVEREEWLIHWIPIATGTLDAGVRGGWDDDIGEFYGSDVHDGRPIEVRYIWRRLSSTTARWEQAFREDGGDWETNWVMDFVRS